LSVVTNTIPEEKQVQEPQAPVILGTPDSQLKYPLDKDSQSIVERILGAFKWTRSNMKNVVRIIEIPTFAIDATVTTGDGKQIYNVPEELDGTLIIAAHAFLTTVSSSGALTVQIRNITQAADMLSTKLTIDSTETDTSTAATPAVIDTNNDDVATGDRIAIDCDAISTTPAKGLYVELTFQLP